jgi:hypothetical protein
VPEGRAVKAIPLVVNRVLNKAGLRNEVAGQQRMNGTHVIAYGERARTGEAHELLTVAEAALKSAGYAVEWVHEAGVTNSYLIVREP